MKNFYKMTFPSRKIIKKEDICKCPHCNNFVDISSANKSKEYFISGYFMVMEYNFEHCNNYWTIQRVASKTGIKV